MTPIRSAFRTVSRRWHRNALTIIATVIGTAAVVAMLGISQAVAQRIADRVSSLDASAISASLPSSAWDIPESQIRESALHVPGVLKIGTLVLPESGTVGSELQNPRTGASARAGTAVASRDGLDARGAVLVAGGFPPSSVSSQDPYGVLLGTALATELGVSPRPGLDQLVFNGQAATVVGTIRDGAQNSVLSTSVVLSIESAAHMGLEAPTRVLIIDVSSGSADAVGAVLPLALLPQSPTDVATTVPPSPQKLRDQLISDTRGLILVVTLVMVVATSFGIVNTMQISVWERRREIGLSRALGMTRRSIARTFLLESAILGGVGSILGWSTGVLITAIVVALNHWTFTLPFEILAIPVIGVLTGSVAGLAPAFNAARVDPAELLRS